MFVYGKTKPGGGVYSGSDRKLEAGAVCKKLEIGTHRVRDAMRSGVLLD